MKNTIRKIATLSLIMFSTFLFSCKQNDAKIMENASARATEVDPGVSVAVNDGVVTLTGTVKDQASKESVANAVKDVKGVKSVVNNTVVESSEVEVNPDNQIRSAIESSFLQKGIRGVDFTVANGVVTLTGEVSRNDLQKVMQAANEANPKKVNNQLKIIN